MSIRIGINPITWTNDDVPELGGDTPLETCLAETAQAGYRGAELGGKFPRASRELGRDLQILEEGHQAADHPIHPAIPETSYLKAFIARLR